jgi:hypothetical protein
VTATSLDLTLGRRRTAEQRFLTVGATKRTHLDCHKAAFGCGGRCWPEWRLYEVELSNDIQAGE